MTGSDIGVYRGAAASIAPIRAYENFLGMPAGTTVGYVLAFMADSPSWSQFEQAILAEGTNGPPGTASASAWAPLLGSRQLMLAVPACCQGTSWQHEASGVNDAHWAALAKTLVSGGLGGCWLRIGREFNGSWYRWSVSTSSSSGNYYPHYQSGYAHVISVMKAAGFTGKFVWNPYAGQGTMGPRLGVEDCEPSQPVIDAIGIDMYDGPCGSYPAGQADRTVAQQQAFWSSVHDSTVWDGLTGWRNLAVSQHKPLCYPEWGLRLWNDAGVYKGGGDDANFITQMAAWVRDTQPLMHGFWEDPGMGVSDPDDYPSRLIAVPQARQAFLEEFGHRRTSPRLPRAAARMHPAVAQATAVMHFNPEPVPADPKLLRDFGGSTAS
jgi:hypothetical protein